MVQDSNTDNKRIAKNTLILYFRAFVMMAIGLFTSRVLLQTLGITDAGINNAVGGIVALFGFVKSSLGNASSRFITYAIGKGDQELVNKTFANIKYIYYGLAAIVLVLGETVGLWFLYTYMNIPDERFHAALWVYHYSILSSMLGLICVPYHAAVIAHERMSAFAFMSLFDVTYKLLILYILRAIPYDRLIVYSTFFFLAGIINRIIYAVYCRRHFEESRTKLRFDKKQFKEIFTFSSWVIGGNLAWIANTHGLNLMLNIFGGPVVNAARGVALQVQGVVTQFVTNFQTALNPQITKTYARGELNRMHNLITWSSKFSYFLLFVLSLPFLFVTYFVLDLWLVEVPTYTESFLRLVFISVLLKTFSNPIWIAVQATGNLKKYQLYDNILQFLVLPTCYVFLKFCCVEPFIVYLVIIFYDMILIPVRISIVFPMINYSKRIYLKDVMFPIVKVTIVAAFLSFLLYFSIQKTFVGNVSLFISIFLTGLLVVWFVGLKAGERHLVWSKVVSFKNKLKWSRK